VIGSGFLWKSGILELHFYHQAKLSALLSYHKTFCWNDLRKPGYRSHYTISTNPHWSLDNGSPTLIASFAGLAIFATCCHAFSSYCTVSPFGPRRSFHAFIRLLFHTCSSRMGSGVWESGGEVAHGKDMDEGLSKCLEMCLELLSHSIEIQLFLFLLRCSIQLYFAY
jgi:hypothetical protein